MNGNNKVEAARRRVASFALIDNFSAAFSCGRPADRSLSEFWRAHRSCGGRDRSYISEAVYAVWRNWGYLRDKLPEKRRDEVEKGGKLSPEEALNMLVLAEKGFPAGRPAKFPEWVKHQVMPGFDLDGYALSVMKRPPMFIRLQCGGEAEREIVKKELAGAGLKFSEVDNFPAALAVSGKVNLFTLESYRKGLFEVQDISSQAIGRVCGARRGERWWDACAGAGGKSLLLADMMERRGEVVASDIRAYKLEDLKKRARRSGFPNIRCRAWDGHPLPGAKRKKFDGVLVDAPCSCAGVWRRNPDGVWTAKAKELDEISFLQKKILSAASTGVKNGGVLVYATCSMLAKENVEVVDDFLSLHPDFEADVFADPFTGEEVEKYVQFSPSGGGDAMFVCRMKRKC